MGGLPKIRSFRDLEIWNRGIDLVERVYALSRSFPKDEMYGLTGQMRRAGVSIPSNMAEGFARRHNAEYRQFLYISLGSCAELTTQSVIAGRLNYLSKQDCRLLEDEIDQISKMTMSLIKKL